jgi:hypothetical protein
MTSKQEIDAVLGMVAASSDVAEEMGDRINPLG